ncbi:MAG: GIY-YIG nuclease family protein, partial [candidate division Zixibacteria bacterium]|nr:GIY-YIG nuclease family protein [candidate division Zixibacteria bacterium]
MPFYTYILRSDVSGRYYCGSTSDLIRRLNQHNDPEYQSTKTTKRFAGPWRLIWSCQFSTRAEAVVKERAI